MAYFRSEMHAADMGWASLARSQWEAITRPEELAKLVTLGIKRLGGTKS
jgi:hypothetical protein